MKAERLLSGLIDWVESVNNRALSECIELVVEGPRDEEALVFAGVRANFTHARNLLRDLRENGETRVRGRTFVIMTDFDDEGRRLHDLLKENVVALGGRVDESPRVEYRKLGLPPLIEDLIGFLERRFPDWDLIRSFP